MLEPHRRPPLTSAAALGNDGWAAAGDYPPHGSADADRSAACSAGRTPLVAGLLLGLLAIFWVVEHRTIYANSAIADVAERDIRDEYIDQIESGHWERQIALLVLGVGGLAALLGSGPAPWRVRWGVAAPLVLLLGWASLSVAWSEQPGVTLKRLVVLGCVLAGAAGLARRFTPGQILTGALLSLSAFVCVSVAVDVAHGGGPWSGGDYRFGGTLHPNAQAAYLGTLCLAAYCQPIGFGGRWLLRAMFFGSFALLLATRSRTGLVALLVALVVVGTLRLPGRVRWAGVALLVAAVAAVTIYFASVGDGARNRAVDAALLGRTEQAGTLTGRVPLWEELLSIAERRPLTGYGYEGFWTPDRIAEIMKSQNWSIQSAHNAYLDIALELGVVGLALGVWVLVAGGATLVAAYDQTRDAGYAFAVGVVTLAAANSLLESLFTDIRYPPAIGVCALLSAALWFPTQPEPADPPARPRALPDFA
ncbi:O-antigen ligase family protein [Botrimarina sp.]|uniref:O-antigen ligase family protein n=1 Tax=Botrimarina sp. TaxID=2795802 RepID=UPI0032F05F3B